MGARTYWSAPVPPLGVNVLTVSSFTTATITDISPQQTVLWPGMLEVGTRVRLHATGYYTATTTASTLTFGFYMNSLATNLITTTPAILAVSAANTAASTATAWPWELNYQGKMSAITAPLVGGTNAQIIGSGECRFPSSLTAWTISPIPQTNAARTVQQTTTGLVTNIAQIVSVGVTIATNTGLTNVACDEFTVELLG